MADQPQLSARRSIWFSLSLARTLFVPLLCIIGLLFAAQTANAQHSEINALAARLAETLHKKKIRAVAVPDCLGISKDETELDRKIADDLVSALTASDTRLRVSRRRDLLQVVDRDAFGSSFFVDEGSRRWLAEWAHADAFAVIHLKLSDGEIHLHSQVYSKDGKDIGDDSAEFPLTPELAELQSKVLEEEPQAHDAEKNGIGRPVCIYCPPPEYPNEAVQDRFQGVVQLKVLIDARGHAEHIRVLKGLPYGMTESAIQEVLASRFDPAGDQQGKLVAVWTIIEVTFRLR